MSLLRPYFLIQSFKHPELFLRFSPYWWGSRDKEFSSLSCVWLFETSWAAAHQVSLSITNSRSLLKLLSIESVMPSSHLTLCRPLLLPSIIPNITVFSNESVPLIRWPKYWSFNFSISPSNEYSGLVGSPCSPRDSQESSPTPQFKSINSLVLRLLYSPAVTSITWNWKNQSFD